MFTKMTIQKFLRELASKKPTPGGGSVAALAGATAAGLVSMAAEFSGNKKIAKKAERFMNVLIKLIDEDAKAFERVMKKQPSQEKALKGAAEVPLQTARYSYEVLKLAEALTKSCNPNVITDIGVAAKMAEAAVEGAVLNVRINLISIKDKKFKKEITKVIRDELYLTSYQARQITGYVHQEIGKKDKSK